MRLTSKGQVTIPIAIREQLGLHPGSAVEFCVRKDVVEIRKAATGQTRGRELIEAMRGRADAGMSTDEIMALTRG